jgi:hypothetical protein
VPAGVAAHLAVQCGSAGIRLALSPAQPSLMPSLSSDRRR